jgi:hypothetical protein
MNDALTVQLLQWIGERPRPYAETIEAWRTSCPRLTIWEDAMTTGLIERVANGSIATAEVRLTPAGRALVRARAEAQP